MGNNILYHWRIRGGHFKDIHLARVKSLYVGKCNMRRQEAHGIIPRGTSHGVKVGVILLTGACALGKTTG